MTFETRTAFPVSAACVIANGVRETLATLLQSPVELRLFEPSVPRADAWRAITAGAKLYRMNGTRADAILIIRPDACRALASAAFGEVSTDGRALSTIESTVVDRIINALAANFAAPRAEPVAACDGFLTYFELSIEQPISARIGVALAPGNSSETPGALHVEDLLDVEIEVRVRTDGTVVQAGELAALEVGAIVPITVSTGLTAVATIAGRPLARGECGVRGNRFALAVGLSLCTEGGSEPER